LVLRHRQKGAPKRNSAGRLWGRRGFEKKGTPNRGKKHILEASAGDSQGERAEPYFRGRGAVATQGGPYEKNTKASGTPSPYCRWGSAKMLLKDPAEGNVKGVNDVRPKLGEVVPKGGKKKQVKAGL